ncbi:MAG: hypothetical protein WA628_05125 [Terriglobales bacterium]
MRSDKAWYWLAAGVFALGLNGAYQDGQLNWAHCLAGRAASMVQRVSDQGLRAVALAEMMLGRNPEASGPTEVVLQRIQTKLVCQRVARAERQIAMAQVRRQLVEADVQRKLDRAQMKMDKVRMVTIDRANRFRNCRGLTSAFVAMPEIPQIDLSNLPDFQGPDISEFRPGHKASSNGPI